MTLEKIIKYLDKKINEKIAAKWDNVGIQQLSNKPFNNFEQEIDQVVVCLDVNQAVIDFAIKNNAKLIVSRHPFLFGDLELAYKNKKDQIKQLLKNEIVVYSIHTNYDASPNQNLLNLLSSQFMINKTKRIGLENEGYEVKLKSPIKAKELFDNFITIFPTNIAQTSSNIKSDDKVRDFYIVSGSGGDTMIDMQLNDAYFITGEMKWHELVYANDHNVQVLLLGHYMENYFVDHLTELIATNFKELKVSSFDIKNQLINY